MPNFNQQSPSISLNNYLIEPEALKLIPEALARKHKMVPLFKIRDSLTIAISDPADVIAIDEAKTVSGCDIQTLKAEENEIAMVIEQNYNIGDSIGVALKGLDGIKANFLSTKDMDFNRLQKIVEEAPVVRLVNLLIFQALKDRASDIHIEPEEKIVKVRFRVDGLLHEVLSFTRDFLLPVVSRIKVVSKLNIVESRLPQDGHFSMQIGDKVVDLRVSTFPVTNGEKVVMRVLDRSNVFISLNKLGFSSSLLADFEDMIKRAYGIILVTGPTGSGKTSTLYAALSKIYSKEKNIVTLEDPREYLLEGISQAEVNPTIGFTFANGLRTILRQDPDIIMVGEIRDGETAQIAIRAALTGHLVLSSLHTNDAPGAITRLIDMGVEPFLVASSLIGIIAQRLVRVICPECKEEFSPSEEAYLRLGLNKENKISLWRGKGCNACRNTGFRGRIAIFELMNLNDQVRDLAIKNSPTAEIRNAAVHSGMKTLQQDGFDKVLTGITTLEEVLRVTL